MDPKIWGDAYWGFMFSTALGYPRNPGIDTQHAYFRYFFNLANVLPCETCQHNFENHIRKLPLNFHLHSRRALLNWVLLLHNEVNRTLGKPPLTAIEAIERYLKIDLNDYPEIYVDCKGLGARSSLISHAIVPVLGDIRNQQLGGQSDNAASDDTQVVENLNFDIREIGNTEILILLILIAGLFYYSRS